MQQLHLPNFNTAHLSLPSQASRGCHSDVFLAQKAEDGHQYNRRQDICMNIPGSALIPGFMFLLSKAEDVSQVSGVSAASDPHAVGTRTSHRLRPQRGCRGCKTT